MNEEVRKKLRKWQKRVLWGIFVLFIITYYLQSIVVHEDPTKAGSVYRAVHVMVRLVTGLFN